MAELLIQARGHWMDNFTQDQIDALDEGKRQNRNARIQLGDIVVVKPDGWNWGAEENLPRYIVVKVPQFTVEQVEHLTASLYDRTDPEKPIMLKKRKWQVPSNWMNTAVANGESVIEVTLSAQQVAFINNLIEKTS